jgi:hypothetical protein
MLIYLQAFLLAACAWADWDLLPLRYHRWALGCAMVASPSRSPRPGLGVLFGLSCLAGLAD